jgi:hypothetical protein
MDGQRGFGGRGDPALRAAVRTEIVAHGRTSSRAIAAALGVPHATVVRVLRRFALVGALALHEPGGTEDTVWVDPASLTARFRDPAAPLW